MRSVEERYRGNGVRVFRLDRDGVLTRLAAAARRAATENPEVLEVRLIGSLARDQAGPGSDADLLITLAATAVRFIARADRFSPYFADVGLGCDILVYTEAELQRMRAEGSRLLRAAEAEGIVLAGRAPDPGQDSWHRRSPMPDLF